MTICLSDPEKTDWTRFLLSLCSRSSNVVETIRQTAPHVLHRELARDPEDFERVRGDLLEDDLWEWVRKQHPSLSDNFGPAFVLPAMIDNPEMGRVVAGLHWKVINANEPSTDLLTSDRPLVTHGKIGEPNFMMALPISPTHLFLASATELELRETVNEIFKRSNRDVVGQAMNYVYGTGPHHMPLVEKRFGSTRAKWDLKD